MASDPSIKTLIEQKLDELIRLWSRKDAVGALQDIYLSDSDLSDAEVSGADMHAVGEFSDLSRRKKPASREAARDDLWPETMPRPKTNGRLVH
ncbi:hypothetical protein QO259_17950 [Salinicola sp. JS01]|uniref:hypothetical protein n=1 Tax=Salinicola sp. JS01 TaxID=3050071 RepID=UPI00255B9FF9|nr:hypothetical protein [Salinicola sp. JS01]WIX32665.1 hypothetical protein QO259_17950 [Salinicola sp. JS01]